MNVLMLVWVYDLECKQMTSLTINFNGDFAFVTLTQTWNTICSSSVDLECDPVTLECHPL